MLAAFLVLAGCSKDFAPVGPELTRPSEINYTTLSALTPVRVNLSFDFATNVAGFWPDWFSDLGQPPSVQPVHTNGCMYIGFTNIYPGAANNNPDPPPMSTWITNYYRDDNLIYPWSLGYSTWDNLPASGNWYYGFWYTAMPAADLYQASENELWVMYLRIKSRDDGLEYLPQRLQITMLADDPMRPTSSTDLAATWSFPKPVPSHFTNVILTLTDFNAALAWDPKGASRYVIQHCKQIRFMIMSEHLLPGTSAGWYIDDFKIMVY
jgi:hypothetical protein